MAIKDLQIDKILDKITINSKIIATLKSKIQTKATILVWHKRTVLLEALKMIIMERYNLEKKMITHMHRAEISKQ
jgi:hypothetical protein